MISLQLPLLVLNPDSCSIATFRRMLQLGAVADNLPSAHWAVRAIGQPPIGTTAPCPILFAPHLRLSWNLMRASRALAPKRPGSSITQSLTDLAGCCSS